MNLKDFLAVRDGENAEFYWALVIEKGWVQAGIWQIIEEKAEVISVSPPAAWETDDELIGAADTALSAAIQNFPEDVTEPSKTVFGVPSSWVSEGQIKKENLEEIRRVCAKLSLEPTGFVVLPEAIAHYYKSQEGSPLNGIVLGVGAEELELSVFKLGNLVGTSVVARSVSVADDVVEGLARFSSVENLPTRILLYDGKEGELEDIRQSLIDTSWEESEKVKFLHTPKVEIIDPDKKVLAVSLAGASEIGQVSSVTEAGSPEQEEETQEERPEETQNITEPDEEVSAQDLGFAIGEDVAQTQKPPEESLPPTPIASPIPISAEVGQETFVKKPIYQKLKLGGIFTRVKLALSSLTSKFKKSTPQGYAPTQPGKKTLGILGVILLSILVFGIVYWWFFPKATVTVFVSPQKLEEEVELSVDTTTTSSDFSQNVLAGKEVETEVSSDKTKDTTGTKRVGETAKGSVKIQNGTASVINVAAGTILLSTSDLRFTADKTASISAALSPANPGTATIEVTAVDIGDEYNLAKDETFKVGNFPKAIVDGVSLANFSGGSSREISAVSEEDQANLEADLSEELTQNAEETLSDEAGADDYFIPGATSAEITSRSFNHKVGDEAGNLKLSLGLLVTGSTVNKNDLFEYSKEILNDKIPSGYVLREEQLKTNVELVDSEDGVYRLKGVISANLLPEIDSDAIGKKIAGRKVNVAEDYLATIPGYSGAEIKFKSKLFASFGTLPRIPKNITIEVSSER